MRTTTAAGLVTAGLILGACGREAAPTSAGPTVAAPARDQSSFANTNAFVTRHLALDVTADFNARTISGTVALDLARLDAAATDLVLDTRDLDIAKAEAAVDNGAWIETTFSLDAPSPAFGRALHVAMPPASTRVRLTYSSSPAAKGLQWLTAAQTAGKKHPFLFTQAQAIQARSFIPLQDTPGVRVTYEATIRTPKDLVAVMAAEMESTESGSGVSRFNMPQAIPSYLIALAVGDLAFQAISPRTGVWAEPSVLAGAAREFADTEQMIQATEKLYGPYRWGRYDLLVLPPSFPFGGMENPRLTFATPTVIAGDKSLVSLVAHELAHSWSGNLVTNATWEDFWLNEGFTTYIERRIVEAVYGAPRADMERLIGVGDLTDARKTLTVARDRTLLPDLTGRDPDDAFSTVPYEQGALFLTFLESKYGRAAFDAFLRKWFDTHAFKSVTTAEFLAFMDANLTSAPPGLVSTAQVQEWLHSETIPLFAVLPVSDAFARVSAAAKAWLSSEDRETLTSTSERWSPQEWIHFLDTLPRPMDPKRLSALDAQFRLTGSTNAEIAHAWFRLAIASHFEPAYASMAQYMIRIGRRKLIVPLYRDLAATPDGRRRAMRIYEQARPGYHPLAQETLDQLLKRPAAR
jgi:leukotriene-A4 hydrolase